MAGQPFRRANRRPIWLVKHTRTHEMHSWNKRDTRGPFYHCLYSYKTFLFNRKRKIFRCESKEFNRLIWSKTYSLTMLKASQEGEKFGSTPGFRNCTLKQTDQKLPKWTKETEVNWKNRVSMWMTTKTQVTNSATKWTSKDYTTWLDVKHFIRKSSKMQIGSGGSDTHRGRRLGKENATGGLGWRHDFLH